MSKEKTTDHTYSKLRLLSDTAKYLEDNWDRLSFVDRDKGWWQVHKASRDVWNILHPPKRKPSKLQGQVDKILGKKGI